MKGWITPSIEYFGRTPILEYVECPTVQDVFTNDKLSDLIPNIAFAAGVGEREIADWLISKGCVQVGMLANLVQFRGSHKALAAAWRKCVEITGPYHRLAFEIVK